MRNKSYYLLFVLYILMFGFILFINGVFTGQVTSKSNLIINIAFLVLIGILMVIAAVHFTRLNQVTDALVDARMPCSSPMMTAERIFGTNTKIKKILSGILF